MHRPIAIVAVRPLFRWISDKTVWSLVRVEAGDGAVGWDHGLISGFMTLAFFGSGLGAISWLLGSSIAPTQLVGLASGALNFIGISMGIVRPLVIGLLRGGDFAPALEFVGSMAGLSAFCYLVGEVRRVG